MDFMQVWDVAVTPGNRALAGEGGKPGFRGNCLQERRSRQKTESTKYSSIELLEHKLI
jgi:hypothetical protein